MRWGGYWRWLPAPLLIARIWIQRGRSGVCRLTHGLLSDLVLMRRLDEAAITGNGFASKAIADVGLRRIAEHLDAPHTTVRTWWRRFQTRSPMLLARCTTLAVSLDGACHADHQRANARHCTCSRWQRAHARFGAESTAAMRSVPTRLRQEGRRGAYARVIPPCESSGRPAAPAAQRRATSASRLLRRSGRVLDVGEAVSE